MTVKRGDIYYADLSPVVGSEQGGIRPVLIVQNDSIVLLEQVRTLDKKRLKEKMGALGGADMGRVDQALSVSLGIRETDV